MGLEQETLHHGKILPSQTAYSTLVVERTSSNSGEMPDGVLCWTIGATRGSDARRGLTGGLLVGPGNFAVL